MSGGWEAFLATGKVTDYLKAKSEERSQMEKTLQTDANARSIAGEQVRADGQGSGWNGRCGAETGCRIM